jgi:hypothetical protein
LRDQLLNSYRGVKEYKFALYHPIPIFEGACADLFSAISNTERRQPANSIYTTSFLPLAYTLLYMPSIYPNSLAPSAYNVSPTFSIQSTQLDDEYEYNWTNRTYRGYGRNKSRGYKGLHHGGLQHGRYRGGYYRNQTRRKYYICNKEGYWFTKHNTENRKAAYKRYYR